MQIKPETIMRHYIKYLSVALLLCLSNLLTAQNVEFDKKNFSDKDGLKQALNNIKEGDKLIEKGSKADMERALSFYLAANKFNPNNAALNYKIGMTYLSGNNKPAAMEFLEAAVALNQNITTDVYYQLARAYQYGYEFDKAIEAYQTAKTRLQAKDAGLVKQIDKYIAECKTGKKLVEEPARVFIDNIAELNSKYPEYGPVISADESVIMFTSRRNNSTGEKIDEDGGFFEDIYEATNAGQTWNTPTNPGKPLNTDTHDAVIGLSNDGQKLFVYRTDNGGDIFESVLKGDSWSKPKSISSKINSKHHESQASLSYDGNTLYFISDRPGGFGEHDIYVSQRDAKGNWGEPINLGPTINTEYDELCVFIHPDGKTLYFSSKGHSNMGGFDVFKSVFEDGKWTTPENLGYPISTPDNDLFFTLSASGKRGYFSSIREGGKGEQDLYMITFLGPEKALINNSEDLLIAYQTNPVSEKVIEAAVEVPSANLTLLKGTVRDDETKNPIGASIALIDNSKNLVIATLESNSKTGRFLVSLPSGINYGISVKADNYLFHSENFDVPESSGYQEVDKLIDMKKIDIGSKIVLRNIFFDTNKSTLRTESIYELTQLINLLNEMPNLKIELSGHTDNRGSASYNQKLSEERAKAVVDYLISKGINASRLTYKGYGFEQPVETNDTEQGRQLNRRTEFKIIEK